MPFAYSLPGKPVNTTGNNLDYATTGIKLTYTAPTGKPAIVACAAALGVGAATQVDLQTVRSSVVYVEVDGAANTDWRQPTLQLTLAAGDSARINVTNATVADVGDAYIGVLEAP